MRFDRLLEGLVLLAPLCLGGCHGNGGGTGSQAVVTQSGPAPGMGLVLQVTNDSGCTIAVEAVTPDEDDSCGFVAPGETISVTLDEVPPWVKLSATSLCPASGQDVSLPDQTFDDGPDYSDSNPFAGVDWTDTTDTTGTDTSGTDGSGVDTSTGGSSGSSDGSDGTDGSANDVLLRSSGRPHMIVKRAARVAFARPVTPVVTRRTSYPSAP